jgi:hypothetical protein
MVAKYPNVGDGNMTARNFFLFGASVYFSLSEPTEPGQLLFVMPVTRPPAEGNASGMQQ